MKAVLISIQPKWCELIAAGTKTVEIRKTRPKLEPPFKCFIYCTKQKGYDKNSFTGKVIGEFWCDNVLFLGNIATDPWRLLAGDVHEYHKRVVTREACLTEEELLSYGGEYGWHISHLIIYDVPKKLSEFKTIDTEAVKSCDHRILTYIDPERTHGGLLSGGFICDCTMDWCTNCKTKSVKKAPQNWCYVEYTTHWENALP